MFVENKGSMKCGRKNECNDEMETIKRLELGYSQFGMFVVHFHRSLTCLLMLQKMHSAS